ncbi:MAG TPA: hypothetical protein VFD84_03205 [Candidatus Binatia bacterium]|nr:hypothetical protein [Candidatus Binatia bacterium]
MTVARSLRFAVAAALLFSQLAMAAPLREARAFAAADCCARRCRHARSVADAVRCCGVEQAADEHATVTTAAAAPLLAAAVVVPVAAPRCPAVVSIDRDAVARAGPLFLVLGILRL